MSDRERSHSRNGSRGHATKERKMSRDNSGSRSRTPVKPHKKYSGSVSPEGYRRYRTRSRSGSVGRRGGGGGAGYRGGGGGAPRYSHSRSRSRSRSYSPRQSYSRRSHSHSPMSSRRRHVGDRENPEASRCLGVFGLSIYTSEQQINHIFSKYGPVERVQVVIDAKTGRSRGFCFVYYESSEDAKAAKDQCTGMEIDGRRIRVDYSITQRAHTPTPGIYMGKATFVNRDSRDSRDNGGYREDRRRGDRGDRDRGDRDRGDRGDRDDYYYGGRSGGYGGRSDYRRRSPSPYYRGGGGGYRRSRYERSHSRSYSPRPY